MAVEIKEIVLRAVLTDDKKEDKLKDAAPVDHEAVVQECVDQVLKVLKKKNRR